MDLAEFENFPAIIFVSNCSLTNKNEKGKGLIIISERSTKLRLV